MKVILEKTELVEFELNEENCEKISHKLFRQLTNFECDKNLGNGPKMALFHNKEEYQEKSCMYNLDLNKDMYILPNGAIFCYIKDDSCREVNENIDTEKDGTTNSEINQTEES